MSVARAKHRVLARVPRGVFSIDDMERHARSTMSAMAWAYVSSGSADEHTLRRNREAFANLQLDGRVLADVARASTRLTLFGCAFEHPILLAPVAYQKLVHPQGEIASIAGAADAGAGVVVSTLSSFTLEAIATQARTPLWFQLYAQPDRGMTEALVQRAEAAGYRALVITVDTPTTGARNREQRASFHLPRGVAIANLRGAPKRAVRAVWPPEGGSLFRKGGLLVALAWKDIEWLQSRTKLPVLLKGIMAPADAERAIAQGIDGLIVSNHGGRNLDTLPATIEVLPQIADVVAGRVPVLLDSGIRRGTDVLKALALGATAIMVGRPFVYGLATAGAAGVAHALNILRAEFEAAMVLTGRVRLSDIDRSVIWRP